MEFNCSFFSDCGVKDEEKQFGWALILAAAVDTIAAAPCNALELPVLPIPQKFGPVNNLSQHLWEAVLNAEKQYRASPADGEQAWSDRMRYHFLRWAILVRLLLRCDLEYAECLAEMLVELSLENLDRDVQFVAMGLRGVILRLLLRPSDAIGWHNLQSSMSDLLADEQANESDFDPSASNDELKDANLRDYRRLFVNHQLALAKRLSKSMDPFVHLKANVQIGSRMIERARTQAEHYGTQSGATKDEKLLGEWDLLATKSKHMLCWTQMCFGSLLSFGCVQRGEQDSDETANSKLEHAFALSSDLYEKKCGFTDSLKLDRLALGEFEAMNHWNESLVQRMTAGVARVQTLILFEYAKYLANYKHLVDKAIECCVFCLVQCSEITIQAQLRTTPLEFFGLSNTDDFRMKILACLGAFYSVCDMYDRHHSVMFDARQIMLRRCEMLTKHVYTDLRKDQPLSYVAHVDAEKAMASSAREVALSTKEERKLAIESGMGFECFQVSNNLADCLSRSKELKDVKEARRLAYSLLYIRDNVFDAFFDDALETLVLTALRLGDHDDDPFLQPRNLRDPASFSDTTTRLFQLHTNAGELSFERLSVRQLLHQLQSRAVSAQNHRLLARTYYFRGMMFLHATKTMESNDRLASAELNLLEARKIVANEEPSVPFGSDMFLFYDLPKKLEAMLGIVYYYLGQDMFRRREPVTAQKYFKKGADAALLAYRLYKRKALRCLEKHVDHRIFFAAVKNAVRACDIYMLNLVSIQVEQDDIKSMSQQIFVLDDVRSFVIHCQVSLRLSSVTNLLEMSNIYKEEQRSCDHRAGEQGKRTSIDAIKVEVPVLAQIGLLQPFIEAVSTPCGTQLDKFIESGHAVVVFSVSEPTTLDEQALRPLDFKESEELDLLVWVLQESANEQDFTPRLFKKKIKRGLFDDLYAEPSPDSKLQIMMQLSTSEARKCTDDISPAKLFDVFFCHGENNDSIFYKNPEHLIIVPDARLFQVPWSCLYDARKQEFLIEKFSISVSQSIKMIEITKLWALNSRSMYADHYMLASNLQDSSYVPGAVSDTQAAVSKHNLPGLEHASLIPTVLKVDKSGAVTLENAAAAYLFIDIDAHTDDTDTTSRLFDEILQPKGMLDRLVPAQLVMLNLCSKPIDTQGVIREFFAVGVPCVIVTHDAPHVFKIIKRFFRLHLGDRNAGIQPLPAAGAMREAVLVSKGEHESYLSSWGNCMIHGAADMVLGNPPPHIHPHRQKLSGDLGKLQGQSSPIVSIRESIGQNVFLGINWNDYPDWDELRDAVSRAWKDKFATRDSVTIWQNNVQLSKPKWDHYVGNRRGLVVMYVTPRNNDMQTVHKHFLDWSAQPHKEPQGRFFNFPKLSSL